MVLEVKIFFPFFDSVKAVFRFFIFTLIFRK